MVSTCGPFRFTSNFDSGNFLKIELLDARRPGAGHGIDHEVNLWTRPDCFGTVFENGNRTWFHFGIRGGKPLGNIKLNILNLNKQVKLFHQGMQPVFRILPERPYWERVPDRLVVNETLDHICSISFRQRLPEDPKKSTLYIAFSYPFSYAELREWLCRLDAIFVQPVPPEFCFDRIKTSLLPKQAENSLISALPIEDEIYYYRECVCYSLERRTVDLITVTSYYGMSSDREERLLNLFPETNEERPFRFPTKKVVFLSARVHPGETPSTFVLNGFFKFVLERHDPRAILLRRMFVFKFIPMLNPDGVARGHYRTDPRGVNLNRVYLNPSPTLHPSIYAARKLLLYYHHGYDVPDDYEYPTETPVEDKPGSQGNEGSVCESVNTLAAENGFSGDGCQEKNISETQRAQTANPEASSASKISLIAETSAVSSSGESTKSMVTASKYTFVLSDSNSLCVGCTISPYEPSKCKSVDSGLHDFIGQKKNKKRRKSRAKTDMRKKSSQDLISHDTAEASSSAGLKVEKSAILMLESEVSTLPGDGEINTVTMENVDMDTDSHQCAFEACDEDSVLFTSDVTNSSCFTGATGTKPEILSPIKSVLSENKEDAGPSYQFPKELKKQNSKGKMGTEFYGLTVRKRMNSPELKLREKTFQKDSFGSVTRSSYKSQTKFNESPSGLFLYVDMHGHATKRGIFMYGNHFSDVATQAECMLLPRLMAMNCHHFDFPACNFTERLMNMKDRRDGMSREGSGRVACLKLTGLVRSYTLECNYNTGRMVNPIVSRPSTYGFTDPPSNTNTHHSPKFTPEIFEGTGRALAESVLDLTGHNPWSRLGFTEFKSLEGMRRWISNRLLHSPEYSQSRISNLNQTPTKEKVTPKKSSSVSSIGRSIPAAAPPRASPDVSKTPKKRSPKKRSSSKVLVELHPHRTATPGTSKRGSETKVPLITPTGVSKPASAPSRRSSLPNRLNCYVVPGVRSKDPVRRDPSAR